MANNYRFLSVVDEYTNYLGFPHPTSFQINLQGRDKPFCLYFKNSSIYDELAWSLEWNSGNDSFYEYTYSSLETLICTTVIGDNDVVFNLPETGIITDFYIVPDSIIDEWYPVPDAPSSSGTITINNDQSSIDQFCDINSSPDLDNTPNWELYRLGLTESGTTYMSGITLYTDFEQGVLDNGYQISYYLIIFVFGFALANFIFYLYKKMMG